MSRRRRPCTLGSSVGQFKLGEIFYRGSGNQGIDGEEVESSFDPTRVHVSGGAFTRLCRLSQPIYDL